MKTVIFTVALLLSCQVAQAQGCFGPVVAGVCRDANHEMERMQRQQHEFERQTERMQRQQREFERQTERMQRQQREFESQQDRQRLRRLEQQQSTDTPAPAVGSGLNTAVIDSSDVSLPAGCEFRGFVARSSPRFGGHRKAQERFREAAKKVGANVVVVTVLNMNSGVPMSGNGYHCPAISEITPSTKIFVFSKEQ